MDDLSCGRQLHDMMTNKSERLQTLDYLRGAAASSILVYHFSSWNFGTQSAQFPIGRMGIYGVMLFYILSGLTMYHVYFPKWETRLPQIADFGIKRVFRIFPLLWLAIVATVLMDAVPVDWKAFFLDVSGAFAFYKWESNYALGAWSIGNELVFYVLFPLILLAAKAGRTWLLTLAGAFLAVFLYFAFVVIDPRLPLVSSWVDYANPLNQCFLFMIGILIGEFMRVGTWSVGTRIGLFVVGMLMLFGYPSEADPASIVSGPARVVLVAGAALICVSAYRWALALPQLLSRPLVFLGETSYGIYILHPIFYNLVELMHAKGPLAGLGLPVSVRMVLAITLTLAGSYLSYRYFEQPMMALGRRLSARFQTKTA